MPNETRCLEKPGGRFSERYRRTESRGSDAEIGASALSDNKNVATKGTKRCRAGIQPLHRPNITGLLPSRLWCS